MKSLRPLLRSSRIQGCVPLLVALVSVAASSANAQPNDRYILTEKSCLLLLPSDRVSDDTLSLTWEPDSARLLTINVHPLDRGFIPDGENHARPEADLIVGRWNKVSHYADVLWKRRFATEPHPMGDPIWIPATQYLAQTVFWQEKETVTNPDGTNNTEFTSRQELLWISAAHSTVREIPTEQGASLEISPTRSLAVIVDRSYGITNKQATLTPVHIDGSTGAQVSLPVHQAIADTRWTTGGSKLLLTLSTFNLSAKNQTTSYALYDPQTGELSVVVNPKDYPKTVPAPKRMQDLVLKSSIDHIRTAGIDSSIYPMWAETTTKSEKPSMLVCSDGDMGSISPDGTAIAYRSLRSSWVSEVKSIPVAEFQAMRAKAQRLVAINNAKQLGLAAIMWASDHDDTYPGPNNINSELMPYLNTDSLFGQFTYTYPGGPMEDIQSPAETILGTVDGPGGQAVIYADGHVKWQNR